VTDRLQRFRAYMERFAAAADPLSTIARGLYVPPSARSVADQIAGRLELQPDSAHLILGGIGSGKTTQLLVAAERLRQLPDMRAVYLDVSRENDLQKLRAGVLVALAGLSFAKLLADDMSPPVVSARSFFHEWGLFGGEYFRHDDDDYDPGPSDDDDDRRYDGPGEFVRVPPVISRPPRPATPSLVSGEGVALKSLTDALRKRVPHVALLVDSLDRVVELDAFE
jgi:hypothetical protein